MNNISITLKECASGNPHCQEKVKMSTDTMYWCNIFNSSNQEAGTKRSLWFKSNLVCIVSFRVTKATKWNHFRRRGTREGTKEKERKMKKEREHMYYLIIPFMSIIQFDYYYLFFSYVPLSAGSPWNRFPASHLSVFFCQLLILTRTNNKAVGEEPSFGGLYTLQGTHNCWQRLPPPPASISS